MSRVYDALRKGQDEIFHVVLPPPVNEAAVAAEPAVPKTAAVSQAAEPVPTISHFVTRNVPPKTAPQSDTAPAQSTLRIAHESLQSDTRSGVPLFDSAVSRGACGVNVRHYGTEEVLPF